MNPSFSVSIVLYKTNLLYIEKLLESIPGYSIIYFVDNCNQKKDIINLCVKKRIENYYYVKNKRNLGYGKAHNIALKMTKSDFHLIANPDIFFDKKIINILISESINNNAIATSPKIINPNTNSIQSTDFTIPTLKSLFLNFFIKKNKIREKRLDKINNLKKTIEVPCLSGAFMLLNIKMMEEKKIYFSKRYHMYFEDIDYSIKLSKKGKLLLISKVNIFHIHQKGSHKNAKLFIHHLLSAIIFLISNTNNFKNIIKTNKNYLEDLFNV